MNLPENIVSLFRERIIISDVAANGDTAKRRMAAGTGQLTKARGFLAKEEWEAAALFAESALMVSFEAYLMGIKLKVATTGGSHKAMAAITTYLAKRASVAIEPYHFGRRRALIGPECWPTRPSVKSGFLRLNGLDKLTPERRNAVERALARSGLNAPPLTAVSTGRGCR
jgi:hypothetical protein